MGAGSSSGELLRKTDFLVGTAGAVGFMAGSYFAYLQFYQDEYKIQTAVQDFLKPYPLKRKEEQVVRRDSMNIIKKLITEWSLQTEKQSSVAAIRPAKPWRSLKHCAEFAVSSSLMSNLQTGRSSCMRSWLSATRACSRRSCAVSRRELEKFPCNLTKFLILLLEVHREVVGGGHSSKNVGRPNGTTTPEGADAMKLVSTTAKTLATDGADQAPTHAPSSAF